MPDLTFLVPRETNPRGKIGRTRTPSHLTPGSIDNPETHHQNKIQKDPCAGLQLDPGWDPYEKARVDPPTELESAWRHGYWRLHRQLTWESLRRLQPTSNSTYRFARCGAQAFIARDKESGRYRIQCFTCKHRLCSACRRRTAGIIVNNVVEHAAKPERRAEGKRLRSITLTMMHSDKPLSEQLTHLMKCFANLRRSKLVKKCLKGGFYVVEVKVSAHDNCWHPHIHLISEGHYVAHADLQAEWLRITGDSHRVHITQINNLQHEVGHHCKYLTKAADQSIYRSARHLDEYVTATKGRRLAGTFGNWRGLRLSLAKPPKGDWQTIGYLHTTIKSAQRGDKGAIQILKWLKEDRETSRAPPTDP